MGRGVLKSIVKFDFNITKHNFDIGIHCDISNNRLNISCFFLH